MRTIFRFAIPVLLLLWMGARHVLAGNLEIIDQWGGTVRDDAVKESLPNPLAVRDKDAWDYVWKATHPDDPEGISPPAVDFDTDMVLIAIVPGPNKASVGKLTLDDKGNVDVSAAGTKMAGPGFGFVFVRVTKDGVKSVNGKALTSSVKVKNEKDGVKAGAAVAASRTVVTPVLSAAEFSSQWSATVGEGAEKKWDVDFAKELVLVVRSAGNSVKVDDVTIDTNGDVKVVAQTKPFTGAATGFGYAILLMDREGVVSVDGKPIAATTQTKPATAPAK